MPVFLVAGQVNQLFALFQGIVLGLVQGITEFLPISSTAHLIIFTDVFGWQTQWNKAAIDAIQFGSVVAVVMYFWKDIRSILSGALAAFARKEWDREEWKILVGIAIGTIPALGMGFVLKKLNLLPESVTIIATMSIVMSLLLALSEKIGTRKRGFDELEIKDGILVGLGQMIALLPGASRSGSTLTAALFLGLRRETAARFSFLLGIPTLAIATLVQAGDVLKEADMGLPLFVGVVSAFVFSYLSIAWLLKFLQRQSTWVFVWYRLALGVTLLIAIATNVLKAV
ncbi:undecaprenyl-diphosphate phosphatase [Leptolyngbya sp. NIES-2104]|uniref:undecaprenyl-diphosphate phosphatase n=1 Tax=Leptolyngbya sp. NIES-2104 TaxID=1552121 RepID=UPI0006EC4E82|nr:undecaprenyl-diphosphate phosphatase [Leptolyngbya sp. NIES-2104]GAP95876.1 undecaprenyl-diphosphatase [Leptolyngbya sp. NIES-2104]